VFFQKPCRANEYRYAVAIEDGPDLRLALAVARRPKNGLYECVILIQREGEWDPHATYHVDGTYHQKSFGQKAMVQRRQSLDQFKGAEHLGSFMGFGTGAAPICNPANFTSVLKVPPGILESMHGSVLIDLVEPGNLPNPVLVHLRTIAIRQPQTRVRSLSSVTGNGLKQGICASRPVGPLSASDPFPAQNPQMHQNPVV
jgi:hypothetical protein